MNKLTRSVFLLSLPVALVFGAPLVAQNLVTNGNFESYSSCPTAQSEIYKATGWYNANHDHISTGEPYPTSDYFNCGYLGFINNPYPCASGSGCVGLNNASTFETAAEMIGAFVNLSAGTQYQFSIKLRLDPGLNFNQQNGALPPLQLLGGNTSSFPVSTTSNPYRYCPSGFTNLGQVSGAALAGLNSTTWQTFTFNFTPTGNYNAIIIGGTCFSDDIFYLNLDDVSITVNCQSSTAATSATASINCPGASYRLSRTGGSLGTGASWKWYTGSCGGTLVGTGSTITVNPSSTTTYYVRAEGSCNTTACRSVTVTIYGNSGTWTWDGSHGDNWHEPCNWNRNKVPTALSDVTIPGGTPNNPMVHAGLTAFCKTLAIQTNNGAMISVNSAQGASLQVND